VASTVNVQGLSQLLKNMEQLPRELVSKNGGLVRSALFQSTKRVRDKARQLAPKQTGAMSRAVVAVRDKDPQKTGASERYGVGVRKVKKTKAKPSASDPFYWRFVEFGTEKMKATPFLRPAFEQEKEAALADFSASLARGIARVTRKMSK
jgi:HK97 gp10 family phage protein